MNLLRRNTSRLPFAPIAWATLLVGFTVSPAYAQRVDDNAVAQAEDAFGINISGENLGLYDPSNVRGFSPTAAGNIRLDGMYIDQQAGFTNRLINGYRILVGPSVLGHPFPAPSGIADFTLRRPGPRDLVSVAVQGDSFGSGQVEIDGQAHDILAGFGMTAGVGVYHNEAGRGGGNHVLSVAVTGVWKPIGTLEIVPFYSRIGVRANLAEPIVLLAGDVLPPPLKTTRFLGQKWGDGDDTATNYGVLSKMQLGGWLLRASVFRSRDFSSASYQPLFVDALPSNFAGRGVIADSGDLAAATSAELQLSRTFEEGPRKHRFYLATWGRDQERQYGATDVEPLSSGYIDQSGPAAKPTFLFGPQTRDHVQQITAGIAYEGAWQNVGSLNVGVQRTDYRKLVTPPDVVLPASTSSPWLFNVAAAFYARKSVTLYAGVSHGLEESDVAPQIALNRSEAPPAIRTSQLDGGVRWAITSHLSLVADLFSIRKPYYGLDNSRIFRNLGTVEHRGGEFSFTGTPTTGLSVVAGAVLLDSTVSGEEVSAGIVGRRPVGYSPLALITSVDYRLAGLKALSFDADVSLDGKRTATVDDKLVLPSRTVLNIGTRYRFSLANKSAILRLQAANVTNAYSWNIVGSGALVPHTPRQIFASVTVDI